MSFNHPKCGGKHDTAAEARACESGSVATITPAPSGLGPLRQEFLGKSKVIHRDTRPSGEQFNYLLKLKISDNDMAWARNSSRGYVGDFIEQVLSGTEKVRGRVSDKTKIPLSLIKAVPDGYYACRPDSTVPHTFFRVSRPKKGKWKGVVKVQTRHGDTLKLMFILNPTDDYLKFYDRRAEDVFIFALVDPRGAALEYGREVGACCKCGKTLTDDRSRYFGIGPDCEQDFPEIIDEVTDVRGPYTGPGWQ